jgi:PDZ domain-containing secreted protein
MENQALRDLYQMGDKSGALIVDISNNSNAYQKLKEGDILLSIDSNNIENDATVEFRDNQYTFYKYYIDKKQIGEKIVFEILRDGKVKKIDLKLTTIADDNLLVDTMQHDVMPKYYIFGGYVFTPLSRNLLSLKRSKILQLREAAREWASDEKQEVVILLKVLAYKTNRGDHNLSLWMIDEVNSKKFKNFKEFVELIENSKEKYLVLRNHDGIKVVIDIKKAKEIKQLILKKYDIKSSQRL